MDNKAYVDPYPKTMKTLGLERINIDYDNNTSIVTPPNIAKDMVALLPDEVFIPESKFLDICCKSGIFLTSIREKLMNSKSMIESFPDDKERYKYITNNQLYGIAPNGQCQMYSVRAVYGTLKVDNPHILCFGVFDQYKTACLNNNHKMLIDEMKKEFGQMKFDVVIGNPPYNKGMDLDFVDLGYKISSKYTVMITPAKWQTAEANQRVVSKISYGEFRQKYVPHMSYVCFYPDCKDVFGIMQADGISWYLIDKLHEYSECTVENRLIANKIINSICKRDLINSKTLFNIGDEIHKYIGTYNEFYFDNYNGGRFKVLTNNHAPGGALYAFSKTASKVHIIGKSYLMDSETNRLAYGETSLPDDAVIVYSSDDLDSCKSFISWINCKFTRFFVAINISKLAPMMCNECFKLVPAPPSGKFDHIYTDEELYKAFNLPQKYIDVIEAVIKERK